MEVEQLKANIKPEDVLRRDGIEQRGKYWKCPFHNDTNPSLSVKGDKFRCFTCNIAGDVIDYYMLRQGVNFKEAVARLNEDFSLGLDLKAQEKAYKKKRNDEPTLKERYEADLKARRNGYTLLHRVLFRAGRENEADQVFAHLNELEGVDIGI